MKLINPLVIVYIISTILFIEAVSFLFCLPVAFIYNESPGPFLWSSLIAFTISVSLFLISRKAASEKVRPREGFLSVSLAWLVYSFFGTLPYLLDGSLSSFIDALFESASGFTTTGATIFGDVESLPHTILFWRSFTQWIGGLGIIVFVIIILPTLGITANQLLPLESSLKEKTHPKTKSVGLRLLYVYLGLTVIQVIFLWSGDMNLFESICHTFSTVSTGGFSVNNNSIGSYSPYSQNIITLFMFLSGVSFVVYYYMVKLNFRKVKHNEELWFYLGTTLFFGTLATSVILSGTTRPVGDAAREGFFQVVSIMTTTGYASADYLFWPPAGLMIIFLLLFSGACTGSTTGGIKMVRHLIITKNIRNTFTKLVHPNVISQIKLNNKPLEEKANISVLSFVVLYLFIFLAGTVSIIILGSDPITAASGVAASMGNVGPGLGSIGPMFNYSHIPEINKLIFSLLMIIGRLEINTFFILLSRSFWRL